MIQLSVVSIPVSDQERAKAFYRDVLGFDLIREVEFGNDRRWVQLKPPSGPVTISLVTWFEAMPPGCVQGLVLDTGDIELMHQRLSARGLIIGAIEHQDWGSYAGFADPDGNGWLLVTAHQR